MKVFAIGLEPHDDLRQSLNNFAKQEDIKAGFILSAIGSLEEAKIRFANQDTSTVLITFTYFLVITLTAYGDS
ncbi:MAG: PPC domain-containing DNA-binding protein [Nostoc sp.]|uniref:PPC domain-containing DNA-binding protein n=1 Tax=Nostoc sp. TaxID=1180 RepID=UPI002FF71636